MDATPPTHKTGKRWAELRVEWEQLERLHNGQNLQTWLRHVAVHVERALLRMLHLDVDDLEGGDDRGVLRQVLCIVSPSPALASVAPSPKEGKVEEEAQAAANASNARICAWIDSTATQQHVRERAARVGVDPLMCAAEAVRVLINTEVGEGWPWSDVDPSLALSAQHWWHPPPLPTLLFHVEALLRIVDAAPDDRKAQATLFAQSLSALRDVLRVVLWSSRKACAASSRA